MLVQEPHMALPINHSVPETAEVVERGAQKAGPALRLMYLDDAKRCILPDLTVVAGHGKIDHIRSVKHGINNGFLICHFPAIPLRGEVTQRVPRVC